MLSANQTFFMHTEYLPPISTFANMIAHEKIEICKAENFQKNSFRNRCRMASPHGPVTLSVPLNKGKNQQMPIDQVTISYDHDWIRLHAKTIMNSYRRAPFFDHFFEPIQQILNKRHVYLFDLNSELIHYLLKIYHWSGTLSTGKDFFQTQQMMTTSIQLPAYPQVFENKIGFLSGLSILDMLFCIGPQLKYLIPSSR